MKFWECERVTRQDDSLPRHIRGKTFIDGQRRLVSYSTLRLRMYSYFAA